MAEEAYADVLNLPEAEPPSGLPGGNVPDISVRGPDIPALREQLAVLLSTGKAKDAIEVQLTHEQMKRLNDKGVEKYTKMYETYVGPKAIDCLFGRCHRRSRRLSKRTQKLVHHKQRALQSDGQPFSEVRSVSCCGQRSAHHHEAYRFSLAFVDNGRSKVGRRNSSTILISC